MAPENMGTRGYKSITRLMGKWLYEPVQKHFAPTARSGQKPSSVERQSPPLAADTMATGLTTVLPDGAKLAYDILGSHHLGKATPLVVICGMTAVRGDSGHLNQVLAKNRPGTVIWSSNCDVLRR